MMIYSNRLEPLICCECHNRTIDGIRLEVLAVCYVCLRTAMEQLKQARRNRKKEEREILKQRQKHPAINTREKKKRNDSMLALRENGMSYSKIAKLFYITPERVRQIFMKAERQARWRQWQQSA